MEKKYKSLKAFYPFYLMEHSNGVSRTLHFIGTSLFLLVLIYALVNGYWKMLLIAPLCGYGFAWVGHFFFEKNKPATFTYPLYSLASDFLMLFHFVTGQLPQKRAEAKRIIQNEFNS